MAKTTCALSAYSSTPTSHLVADREQVFLFTRNFAVNWTNNVSERGAKAAKRHQAASGY